MPTIEERVQALEQENANRKKTEELLTTTVRALVSKEAFEELRETVKESQEQNGKLFNVLINQGSLHNERLSDLQNQIIQVDGKVVGLQTEMRQHFAEVDRQLIEQDGKIVGMQTEMRQHFTEIDQRLTGQDSKITSLQTTQTEQTILLQQILGQMPATPEQREHANVEELLIDCLDRLADMIDSILPGGIDEFSSYLKQAVYRQRHRTAASGCRKKL